MDWHIGKFDLDHRRRSFESLRIQISKMSEGTDMNPQFSDKVSVNHLLSLILKQTLDVMNVRVCIIWLKDRHGNLIPRISFGLKTDLIRAMKTKVTSWPIGTIIRGDEPVAFSHIDRMEEEPSFRKLAKTESLYSVLASPLKVGGEKIGVLMICTHKPHQFTHVEIKIFDALARQAALAIGNVGLYERIDRKIKEKIRKMSAIFSMSRTITSSIDENLIFEFILEKTSKLMNAQACTLSLFDRSYNRLKLRAHVGIDKAVAEEFKEFEQSFAREALKTEMPCMINDLRAYFQNRPPWFIEERRIYSLIVMPLVGPKRRVGILAVYMPDVRIFSREDIEVLEMICSLCSMAIENMNMLERIKEDYLNMVKTLAKIIDENDRYTRGHCDKVMKYSLKICRKLELPERCVHAIRVASLLHDIGKIGIDISIVRKRGRLTDKERLQISHHSEIGARIVNQLGFLNEVVPIIRHHHERFKGGGYPEPERKGDDIPLGARILAVADAYDAMTSDRPYRQALSRDEAIAELKRCSNEQFDPKIVGAFLETVKNS